MPKWVWFATLTSTVARTKLSLLVPGFSGLVVVGLLLAMVSLGATVARGQKPAVTASSRPFRSIVILEDHSLNNEAVDALENLGGRVLKELPLVNGLVVLLPSEAAVPEVEAVAGVARVEPDIRVFALHHRPGHDGGPPSDNGDTDPEPEEEQTLEWGVDRIDAELAWATSTGQGVAVAVIDTGIDKDHPDLTDNLSGGINFVAPSTGPPWQRVADPDNWDDDNGHGTHVAGIVGASNNQIGVIGTAPQSNLWAVKVLDKNGSGFLSDVIDGINWSVNNNIAVINMSLGTSSDSTALNEAVDAAYQAGVVLVAAAGNSGDGDPSTNEVLYPAKYDSVVAVAATDKSDGTPSWSSEGEQVELAAPGVEIRSTWNDGSYHTISGTSMASPHAAGTAALVLTTLVGTFDADADGSWDPAEVRAALQATAEDLGPAGFDNFYGHGLVDAEQAVAE
ncbi:MAG: hypothetical protein COU69_02790 [Candidatus Pacebacteria bacterium CG10_big_fil_rev_8_21_14_0_10_56_10]|nr:MAG: hypothetical protein COU69_02790 [Candidatus Pacebacteria bacterium CG10_big_fil_rev_8_21_14_0_10_56_10]